ncbi:MAG: phosphoribosyl transferase [Candidatus Zambryskibacteria bacterium CG_4_9_14_3_um_filter_42_9]|uniref:Phosphoribosyl transferase n=1 Tax=Candidatus Zambryskibacteria bacterium CG22_combo_CG10-13_8_21_14_all_42_17 TaxID=1975118 RepID=A0A2H0BDD2_9BACT|nr:MAG: phosphoribosyl transferase [Candidatus Zambryskibacteria bacterium CG22_combo_CG10-13_8_21_14_all_42_17]PJA36658.1 MAG: phosphoribosyl transferase [Candidatus Zambryskibacteria bacterium CG_4_9_14_3_um_filter_42_9]
MRFKNRDEAGQRLAERLKNYAKEDVVIYALPRGGVVVGAEVARILQAPLDILTARKVSHPDFPEFAIAAVGQDGYVVKNEEAVLSIGQDKFDKLVKDAQAEAQRRHGLYLKGISVPEAAGKIAIIVDDGLATGLTVKAAISDLRSRKPKKIVLAVPVAPDIALTAMVDEVDDFVCLYPDPNFIAVGAYYEEFSQVSDDTVIEILRKINKHKNEES